MKRIYLLILMLFVFARGWCAGSATVKAEIEHDVDRYGLRGMLVHVKLHTDDALNEMARVRLVFYNDRGDEVPAYNKSFSSDGEGFCIQYEYAIPYEHTDFNKLTYFVPYIAFGKLARADYYLKVWVHITSYQAYESDSKARSENIWFRYLGSVTQPLSTRTMAEAAPSSSDGNSKTTQTTQTTQTVYVPVVQTPPAPMPHTVQEVCSACHGTGRQEHYTYTSQVGTFYCYECGKQCQYGHGHVNCHICGGSGKVTRTVYY